MQKSHFSDRYTKTGQCKACLFEWKAENKGKVSNYEKHYQKSDAGKESARKRSLSYYRKNRELILVKNKSKGTRKSKSDYKKRNPNKCAAHQAKRRATLLSATPLWFEDESIGIIYQKAYELGMEVDHIVPLVNDYVCGLHCWHNLQLLNKSENASKSNKEWVDM